MKELIHKFSGKTLRLNRFGIINDTVPFAYDYFASELPEEITSKIADCFGGRLEVPVLDRLEKTRRMDVGAFHSGKPLFAFCKVVCGKDEDTVIIITATGSCKLWINGRTAAGNYGYCDYVCKLKLRRGENLFVVEMPETSKNAFMAVRLSSYAEECRDSYVSLCRDNYSFADSKVSVMSNGTHFFDRGKLKLIHPLFFKRFFIKKIDIFAKSSCFCRKCVI